MPRCAFKRVTSLVLTELVFSTHRRNFIESVYYRLNPYSEEDGVSVQVQNQLCMSAHETLEQSEQFQLGLQLQGVNETSGFHTEEEDLDSSSQEKKIPLNPTVGKYA